MTHGTVTGNPESEQAERRSVVLPSVMTLLGDRNWYLPGWLEWIPHLEVEGHTASESNIAAST